MSTSETAINSDGKRPSNEDTTTDTPTETSKRAKTSNDRQSNNTFRSWSNQVNESSDTSTVYTINCTFGDASKPLPSFIKSGKVQLIKNELQMRGLSTIGNKAVLLQRLQTELPSVTIEIDSRECLQRVVNSMLYHFDWDNTHLFQMNMPRHGDLLDGLEKLWLSLPTLDIGLAIKQGSLIPDLTQQDPRVRRRLEKLGVTSEIIAKVQEDPEGLSSVRKISGAGFDPVGKGHGNDFEGEGPSDGGWFSIEELALEKGDKMDLLYDFGQRSKFFLRIQDVKQNAPVLPEANVYHHKTRVKLVSKGVSKMRKQYDHGGRPY